MKSVILILAIAVAACTPKPIVPSLTPTKALHVDPWAMHEGDGYPKLEDRAYSEADTMGYIAQGAVAYETLLKKYRILRNVITNLQKD